MRIEADENRSFTCKVVLLHIATGDELRGRTFPGSLRTFGTLARAEGCTLNRRSELCATEIGKYRSNGTNELHATRRRSQALAHVHCSPRSRSAHRYKETNRLLSPASHKHTPIRQCMAANAINQSINSINQFTFYVFGTHQGSQQTITGKTVYTKH